VLVAGVPIAHYAVGDAMAEAYAMVQLVTRGWAEQNEVARAFGRSERSVQRYQRRFEGSGLIALGRPGGLAGRPRVDRSRDRRVNAGPAADPTCPDRPVEPTESPGSVADPNLSGPPPSTAEHGRVSGDRSRFST
jgi:hypothetical protein